MKKMTKLLFCFVLFANNSAYAEITTDGTTGAIQHLSGQMTIPQSLGTTAGNNLFHSFQTFNINTGESATFTGDAALKNVISRVTGGQISHINGVLKSSVGNANFYFINPAGVTFGSHSQVDVPAAFHLSTANSVHFSNGDFFSSSLAGASTLSVADPVGFGFLNNQAGNIHIKHSKLNFKEGSSVSLSAANLTIDNSKLKVPAGTLQVNAVGHRASEVFLKTPASTAFSGNIQMSTNSLLNVSGSKAGLLILRAGGIALDTDSSLLANNKGDTANTIAGIDILAKTINLVGDNTIVSSTAFAKGNAGAITIKSDDLTLRYGSAIRSNSHNSGHAGNINIDTHSLTVNGQNVTTGIFSKVFNNPQHLATQAGKIYINSDNILLQQAGMIKTSTQTQTNAGDISLHATQKISINGESDPFTGVFSDAQGKSQGNSGNISLTANELWIENAGQVNTNTSSLGHAGDIGIVAKNVFIDGYLGAPTGVSSLSAATAQGIAANAGSIDINTDRLALFLGGFIKSNTESKSNAGNITLTSKEFVIKGFNSSVETGIFSNPLNKSTGNAGKIQLTGNKLNLLENASISSAAGSLKGNAGDITLTIGTIELDGNGGAASISSNSYFDWNSYGLTSSSSAGHIFINTISLSLLNDSEINNYFNGTGLAGSTNITAHDILIDGQGQTGGIFNNSQIGANSTGSGIYLKADTLTILNGGQIGSSVVHGGKAGDIKVDVRNTVIDGQGSHWETGFFSDVTFDSTNAAAGGGSITMNGDQLTVLNGGKISSNAASDGNAGDITLNVGNILINGENSTETGVFTYTKPDPNHPIYIPKGSAGKIIVTGNNLTLSNNSSINSSTFGLGSAGEITIRESLVTLNNSDISSEASITSGGQTGNVIVTATKGVYLSQDSRISMKDDATVANPNALIPTFVKVSAPDIDLKDSRITTEATGNVNGGDITVIGGELIKLQNSAFLTSVTGEKSKGGNINVSANTLILDNGAIQANAKGGQGGEIKLILQNLIPSENQLIKGGAQVVWQQFQQGLNVIQAASENGVNASITLTSPQFNISGSMSGLDTSSLALPALKPNPCQDSVGFASSLVRGGNGGIPNNEAKTGFIPAAAVLPNSKQSPSKISLVSQQQATYTASQKNTNYSCAALSSN